MTKSEEYANKILKEIENEGLDAAVILQRVKGQTATELEIRESLLMTELSQIRTQIMRVEKV